MPHRFAIVRPMNKASVLLAFLLLGAVPAAAQTSMNEFGILFGGSRASSNRQNGVRLDSGFELSNSSLDIYYGVELEPGTMFRIKAGRIETPVSFARTVDGVEGQQVVFDDGTVEHVEGLAEYRFSEAFGSTSLFAGVGLYRHRAEETGGDEISSTNYGFSGGVNADFPLTRRYGVKLEATYHWVSHEFRPSYITVSAGLRLGF